MFVLLLAGCFFGRRAVGVDIAVDTAWSGGLPEEETDYATEGETDTFVEPSRGGLVIGYAFEAIDPVADCRAAGLTTLDVALGDASATFPCDDQPIRWLDAPSGETVLRITSGSPGDARWWDSGEVSVVVPEGGEPASASATIVCQETPYADDACGGG